MKKGLIALGTIRTFDISFLKILKQGHNMMFALLIYTAVGTVHYLTVLLLSNTYEPRCEKTGLWEFQPGATLTNLYSHKRKL